MENIYLFKNTKKMKGKYTQNIRKKCTCTIPKTKIKTKKTYEGRNIQTDMPGNNITEVGIYHLKNMYKKFKT